MTDPSRAPLFPHRLHLLVRRGGVDSVLRLAAEDAAGVVRALELVDRGGCVPLAHAVRLRADAVRMTRALLRLGARVEEPASAPDGAERSVLALAMTVGEPELVELLLQAGADVRRTWHGGAYGVLDEACRHVGPRTEEILDRLVRAGAPLDTMSPWGECAVRECAFRGRFDLAERLLAAGADPSPLRWTPLHRAVARGRRDEAAAALDAGVAVDALDSWGFTAWAIAALLGDFDTAVWLETKGADRRRGDSTAIPILTRAILAGRIDVLRELLARGADPDPDVDSLWSPLRFAAECDAPEAIRLLVEAGADVNGRAVHDSPLRWARSRDTVTTLLALGADPAGLAREGIRALCGLPPGSDLALVSDTDPGPNARTSAPPVGTGNPTEVIEPLLVDAFRTGCEVAAVLELKGHELDSLAAAPCWSADRFGQTATLLPDGRIVLVGGEHEDFYDPEFHIYADVIVVERDGRVRIFEYGDDVFPPTDFHTATLLDGAIWIVGGADYAEHRRPGVTRVHRLDPETLRIERIDVSGPAPGWIFKHRATRISDTELRIDGGVVAPGPAPDAKSVPNPHAHVLDVRSRAWRRADAS